MKKFLFASFALLLSSMCFLTINAKELEGSAHERAKSKEGCCCQLKCTEFGSFYTNEEVVVAPEFAIPFNYESDHVHHSQGIEHAEGGTDFVIKEPGVYKVIYSVSLESRGQVALTLDGVVVAGSEIYVEKGEQLNTLALLIKVCDTECCGKTLRVINHNSPSSGWYDHNIQLKTGRHHNVTAAIVIEKIAECCDDCKECSKSSDKARSPRAL